LKVGASLFRHSLRCVILCSWIKCLLILSLAFFGGYVFTGRIQCIWIGDSVSRDILIVSSVRQASILVVPVSGCVWSMWMLLATTVEVAVFHRLIFPYYLWCSQTLGILERGLVCSIFICQEIVWGRSVRTLYSLLDKSALFTYVLISLLLSLFS
jgi:hypothetical protein